MNVLEHDELIISRSDGLFRRFYPSEARIPPAESNDGIGYTHVQLNATQDKIISHIERKPGMTQKELAKILGKSTQVVNYNVNAMAQLGIVELRRDGNKTKCYVQRIVRIDDSKEIQVKHKQ